MTTAIKQPYVATYLTGTPDDHKRAVERARRMLEFAGIEYRQCAPTIAKDSDSSPNRDTHWMVYTQFDLTGVTPSRDEGPVADWDEEDS